MEKKKVITILVTIIVMILLVVLTIIGTVAFFGWKAEKEATVDVTIASGVGSCTLRSDNEKFIEPSSNRYGGRVIRLNAKQELGEKALISWNLIVNEINELQDKTFKYELINYTTGASYGSGTFENITSGTTITFSNNNDVLGFNREYMFVLYLWIDGTFGNNPLTMTDQEFNFDINCNMTSTDTGTVENENVLMSVLSEDSDAETDTFLRTNEEGEGLLRSEVSSVTFTKTILVPEGYTEIDVSENQDGSVIMWYSIANDDSLYDVYIGGNNGKVRITDGTQLFAYLTNAKTIDFANAVDTSNMTSLYRTFMYTSNIESINFTGFDTSNVTNMVTMFGGSGIKELNVSMFDTSKVTSFKTLFTNCTRLTKLDLSNWNTLNVDDMCGIFQLCTALTNLDVSSFDTLNVTDMSNMFHKCYVIKSLDLSSFITTNVKIMTSMFNKCYALTNLDVSNFNTSNVTDMGYMFSECESIKKLNISSFNTSSVIDMHQMFYKCYFLEELDLSNFNTINVSATYGMFAECKELKTIYVSDSWITNAVTNSTQMFLNCNSLVGGSGTTYNASYIDKTYARVDGGTDSPGYFTYKAASV